MGCFLPTCTNDVGDYLNSEGSDEDMPEIGSSTQRDETEDVGTLETSATLVEDIPLPVAPMEMPAPEVFPAAEGAVIEHVATTEPVFTETPQDEVAESEVNITTSAPVGKTCSVLNLAHIFLYLLLNLENFTEGLGEVPPSVMSEPG